MATRKSVIFVNNKNGRRNGLTELNAYGLTECQIRGCKRVATTTIKSLVVPDDMDVYDPAAEDLYKDFAVCYSHTKDPVLAKHWAKKVADCEKDIEYYSSLTKCCDVCDNDKKTRLTLQNIFGEETRCCSHKCMTDWVFSQRKQ